MAAATLPRVAERCHARSDARSTLVTHCDVPGSPAGDASMPRARTGKQRVRSKRGTSEGCGPAAVGWLPLPTRPGRPPATPRRRCAARRAAPPAPSGAIPPSERVGAAPSTAKCVTSVCPMPTLSASIPAGVDCRVWAQESATPAQAANCHKGANCPPPIGGGLGAKPPPGVP